MTPKLMRVTSFCLLWRENAAGTLSDGYVEEGELVVALLPSVSGMAKILHPRLGVRWTYVENVYTWDEVVSPPTSEVS